jgi:hypothetical protein
MTPVEGRPGRYSKGMKVALALIAVSVALGAVRPAGAAGFDEALRAAGISTLTKAPRTPAEAPRTPDWDGTFAGALALREEVFLDSQRSECGGAPGCGRQVSEGWLAGRQMTAASRALEETLLHRYGVRGWARAAMADRTDLPHAGLAALTGAALLYADGLHARTVVKGVRVRVDLMAGRRLSGDKREVAKVEVGGAGRPVSLTAAFGRRAPALGLGYRLRY